MRANDLFRGAMLCMVKQPRKSKQVLALASQQIITRKFLTIMQM